MTIIVNQQQMSYSNQVQGHLLSKQHEYISGGTSQFLILFMFFIRTCSVTLTDIVESIFSSETVLSSVQCYLKDISCLIKFQGEKISFSPCTCINFQYGSLLFFKTRNKKKIRKCCIQIAVNKIGQQCHIQFMMKNRSRIFICKLLINHQNLTTRSYLVYPEFSFVSF